MHRLHARWLGLALSAALALFAFGEATVTATGASAATPAEHRLEQRAQTPSDKDAKKKKAKKKKAKSNKKNSGAKSGGGALGPGRGRVTFAGKTFDVIAEQCMSFGSIGMMFRGAAVDDKNVIVQLEAGDEAGMSVRDDSADTFYRAGDIYVPFGASIPDTAIKKGTATGSATLANVNAAPGDTAEASFEFRC